MLVDSAIDTMAIAIPMNIYRTDLPEMALGSQYIETHKYIYIYIYTLYLYIKWEY